MVDREKVVANVTGIVSDMQEEVDEWKDYSDSELSHGLTCDCDWWYKTLQTLKDALALLKAQESGKVNITITQSDGWKEGNCPFCGMKVDSFYNWSYCGTCGKGLEWE